MASLSISTDEAEIASILSGEISDTKSDVSETLPLNKSRSVIQRNSWLRRLRKSVLIKSKAANMILLWTFLMYFVRGIVLDPNNSFFVSFGSVWISIHESSRNTVSIAMIGSGVYGVIAVWLLFYPLAGYLADVRYGRYKVIFWSIRLVWGAMILFIIGAVIISAVIWPVVIKSHSWGMKPGVDPLFYYELIMGLLVVCTFLMLSIGFAGFAANVVQFGIDQLQDLPARDSFLFIYWHLLVQYIGIYV